MIDRNNAVRDVIFRCDFYYFFAMLFLLLLVSSVFSLHLCAFSVVGLKAAVAAHK